MTKNKNTSKANMTQNKNKTTSKVTPQNAHDEERERCSASLLGMKKAADHDLQVVAKPTVTIRSPKVTEAQSVKVISKRTRQKQLKFFSSEGSDHAGATPAPTLHFHRQSQVAHLDDFDFLDAGETVRLLSDSARRRDCCRTFRQLVSWKWFFCMFLWTGSICLLRDFDYVDEEDFNFGDDGWGFIVGLLLVFRTNQGIQRWWEARCCWQQLTSNSICLLRQTNTYGQAEPLSKRVMIMLMAFAVAAKNYLRGGDVDENDRNELEQLLPPKAVKFLMDRKGLNRASACLDYISRLCLLETSMDSTFDKHVLTRTVDAQLKQMNLDLQNMHKIKTTPIPFVYALLLRICNFTYLLMTPLKLISSGLTNWSVLAYCMLFGFSFIAIDQTGQQMQDPFGNDVSDLPLEDFVAEIINQLLDLHKRWYFDKELSLNKTDLRFIDKLMSGGSRKLSGERQSRQSNIQISRQSISRSKSSPTNKKG